MRGSLSVRGRVFRGFQILQRVSEVLSQTLSEPDFPLRGSQSCLIVLPLELSSKESCWGVAARILLFSLTVRVGQVGGDERDTHTHTHTHTHEHTRTHTNTHTHTHTHTHEHTRTHTNTHEHTRTHRNVHAHVAPTL